MINIIGYGLIMFAGYAMHHAGLAFNQWETWAIILGFVIGEALIGWRD